MIKVLNVTKHFEDFEVLKSINLHIRKGTIYVAI